MILAFDTYYYADRARTVCFKINEWTDEEPVDIVVDYVSPVAEYESGNFYKRELPCILSALDKAGTDGVEAVIIDGFVVLDDSGKPGLGRFLYDALDGKIPVIGIAKRNFAGNVAHVRQVLRGDSKNPLYVTAVGMLPDDAALRLQGMAGPFRIPTILKKLDGHTRLDD
jgi:exodeoxyribonuclease-5/deoxyribonuclease V